MNTYGGTLNAYLINSCRVKDNAAFTSLNKSLSYLKYYFRINEEDINLFDKNDYGRLDRWRNDFRFCACPAISGAITNIIRCGPDHAETNLQQQCTEQVITDHNTVRCELARKKRSTYNVTYTSQAPWKTDIAVYMVRINTRFLYSLLLLVHFIILTNVLTELMLFVSAVYVLFFQT